MCGITCIVALEGQTHEPKAASSLPNGIDSSAVNGDEGIAKLAKELDDSLELIKHRGPDSRGQWISPDKRVGPLSIAPLYYPVDCAVY